MGASGRDSKKEYNIVEILILLAAFHHHSKCDLLVRKLTWQRGLVFILLLPSLLAICCEKS